MRPDKEHKHGFMIIDLPVSNINIWIIDWWRLVQALSIRSVSVVHICQSLAKDYKESTSVFLEES